jgi:hypothetical protein
MLGRVDEPARRPWGVTGICIFFAIGALICFTTLVALLFPGSLLEAMWRTKPEARAEFMTMGRWALVLMTAVGTALAAAASGLWRGRRWGQRLGIGVLVVNAASDAVNAVWRQPSAAVGVVIAGLLVWYLARNRAVRAFVSARR